ncbi:ABC transporter ATP-binding protein [Lacticaseibacillus pantheris]
MARHQQNNEGGIFVEEKDDVLLDIQHLHTAFRNGDDYFDAVNDVSLELHRDEVLAIVGESGCGKSTLATSIIGLHDPHNTRVTGTIQYNTYNLVDLNEKLYNQFRGKDIGMIFQDPLAALNPLMRIGDQIAETLVYHTDMNKDERQQRVLELLDQVGIPEPKRVARQYPHELSGGMRQRVVIAIAIACKPPIIIADEPTTALDVTIQAQILDLLANIQKESHSGIILITHDLGVVAEVADRVAVMYAGQIVEQGTVGDVFNHPQHPYTRSLLRSMPQADSEDDELHVIQGTVPDLKHMQIDGCRFAQRIPWIPASAHEEHPSMHEVAPGHLVQCTCYRTFHFEDDDVVAAGGVANGTN